MDFKVQFVTYRGVYRNISTEKLTVPSIDGRRTILSNHMPIMLALEVGRIETIENGQLRHYAITDGMMYFEDNEATVVCDTVFCEEDIDETMAEKYKQIMEKRLAGSNEEDDIFKAKIALTRAAKLLNDENK